LALVLFCQGPATKNEKALPLPKEKQSFSVYKTRFTGWVILAEEEHGTLL
jgi:hypothetical protein